MKGKGIISVILGSLILSGTALVTVHAGIASEEAFKDLRWEKILEDEIVAPAGVVQAVCATDEYIITLENYGDLTGQPDTVKAYYRNRTDKDGNPVEQYSLAKSVAETDYEHANGMAYNPNTNEIAVSLYTDYNPENEGCLFLMDADTLQFKEKVKVAEGYNILGIGYDEPNDRYIIQANSENDYKFQILNSEFQITEELGDLGAYAADDNYQDLCVTEDYILNFPLTLFSGVGDYLNVFSISQKKMLYSEKLDFQLEDAVSDEPESICELEPGVFVAAVNVSKSDGSNWIELYRTEVPYLYQVTVTERLAGETAAETQETKDVLRGDSFSVAYPEKDGYRIASVTVDKTGVDLEKYGDQYTLDNIQGSHSIQIIYDEEPGVLRIAVTVLVLMLVIGSIALYLRVLQVRRIRRAKLRAEQRRRARIKWQNDEWNIDG